MNTLPFNQCGHAHRERGSVLVVVIAVLAILTLMATAFISALQLQKTVSGNINNRLHAEIACKSGLVNVLGEVVSHYSDSGVSYTALNQDWYESFARRDASQPESECCGDLLEFLGPLDPYPDVDDPRYNGWAQWKTIDVQDPTITVRYAALVLDLCGRLPTESTSSSDANLRDRFGAMALHGKWIQDGSIPAADITAAGTVFNQETLSFLNAQQQFGGAPHADFVNAINPFNTQSEITKFGTASAGKGALNLNTAPRMLLNAIALYTTEKISGGNCGFSSMNAIKTITDIGDGYGYNDTRGSVTSKDAGAVTCTGKDAPFLDFLNYYARHGSISATTYDIDIAKALIATFNQYSFSTPCAIPIANVGEAFLKSPTLLNAVADINTVYNNYDKVNGNSSLSDDPYSVKMETAANDVCNSIFGFSDELFTRSGTDYPTKQGGTVIETPQLYVGKSVYFYTVIRGEVIRTSSGKQLAERNLEAVIYVFVDNADLDNDGQTTDTFYKIIYQRWFTR
jgi:hypothetical protein